MRPLPKVAVIDDEYRTLTADHDRPEWIRSLFVGRRAPSIKVNGEIFSVGKRDLSLTRALALKTMETGNEINF